MGKRTPAELITEIVREYHRIPHDTVDIDRVFALQKRLAAYMYGLAMDLGQATMERDSAEYRRKSAFAAEKKRLIDEGMSAAKAEAEADVLTDDLRKEQAATESAYQQTRLILDAAKMVWETMRQHVSNIKTERRQAEEANT